MPPTPKYIEIFDFIYNTNSTCIYIFNSSFYFIYLFNFFFRFWLSLFLILVLISRKTQSPNIQISSIHAPNLKCVLTFLSGHIWSVHVRVYAYNTGIYWNAHNVRSNLKLNLVCKSLIVQAHDIQLLQNIFKNILDILKYITRHCDHSWCIKYLLFKKKKQYFSLFYFLLSFCLRYAKLPTKYFQLNLLKWALCAHCIHEIYREAEKLIEIFV